LHKLDKTKELDKGPKVAEKATDGHTE